MANPFLNKTDLVDRDVETALMLERAMVHDIGNAVAYTDGNRIFINTDDNLNNILPAYDQRMLKWLLWHERMHLELRHHNRFFKYLKELDEEKTMDEFHVTKSEVNIIMDILVHDSMIKMFPELVETAVNNLAQIRNRNSLSYTFKTFTLEEMLEEYAKHKKGEDTDGAGEGEGEGIGDEKSEEETEGKGDKKEDAPEEESKDNKKEDKSKSGRKGHAEGGKSEHKDEEEPAEDGAPEEKEAGEPPLPDEHDKTDWSKLEDIDEEEFIDTDTGDRYEREINELKRKKFKLGKLTETLNGLVTSQRKRSYAMPSTTYCGGGIMLKGSTPGRTKLALCFDASGSMGRELETFKDIITKSIPQAMQTPTSWFSGWGAKIKADPAGRNYDYYKAQFKDIMPVHADNGYSDDGDRTIELCWEYEQQGYCPIGVTDGGGQISWSKDKLKQLKHTVLVGQNKGWLEAAKRINPNIQILDI